MITLIDYGAGNLHSLEGALDSLGFAHRRVARPEDAPSEGLLLLPGVGHFGAAQAALRATGWWDALPRRVKEGRPLLGICLGLQLLAEGSEEAPGVPGLGLLPGFARRLGPGVKVPHMGWAPVKPVEPGFKGPGYPEPGFPEPGWLYFVHSFALPVTTATLAVAEHGRPFTALVGQGRVLGFQPHPEKSGPFGRRLLAAALCFLGESPFPEFPCS